MKEIIDQAIEKLKAMGVTPVLVNLTDEDFAELEKETDLDIKRGEDYADGYIKNLTFYKDVEIDCRVLDKDEATHPLLSESYIASSEVIKEKAPIENGRLFSLRTLKEML